MEEAVKEKRRCFKLWKAGGSRAAYNTAKRTSNLAVQLLGKSIMSVSSMSSSPGIQKTCQRKAQLKAQASKYL